MENSSEVRAERIQTLAKAIIEQRQALDFMTVAKAMVLQATHERGSRAGAELADVLGISKQTRSNWLNRKLLEWVETWEQRIRAGKERVPPPKKGKIRITEPEWRWVAQVLTNESGSSWEHRRRCVERAAAKEPAFGHLRNISRATLWKNRGKFIGLRIDPKSSLPPPVKESGENVEEGASSSKIQPEAINLAKQSTDLGRHNLLTQDTLVEPLPSPSESTQDFVPCRKEYLGASLQDESAPPIEDASELPVESFNLEFGSASPDPKPKTKQSGQKKSQSRKSRKVGFPPDQQNWFDGFDPPIAGSTISSDEQKSKRSPTQDDSLLL